jgi:hypothetical protein
MISSRAEHGQRELISLPCSIVLLKHTKNTEQKHFPDNYLSHEKYVCTSSVAFCTQIIIFFKFLFLSLAFYCALCYNDIVCRLSGGVPDFIRFLGSD